MIGPNSNVHNYCIMNDCIYFMTSIVSKHNIFSSNITKYLKYVERTSYENPILISENIILTIYKD